MDTDSFQLHTEKATHLTPSNFARIKEDEPRDQPYHMHFGNQSAMTANTVRCESGKVELHTSRLRLRAATTEDAHPLYNAFKDPEVMKYW